MVHASEPGRLQRQRLLGRRHQPRYSRLDPTAGTLAVLGVLQHTQLSDLWSPLLPGAVLLVLMAAFDHRSSGLGHLDPAHWC